MQDAQPLLDQARELGEAIARHERVKIYLAAQQAVQKDPATQALLKEYAQHMEHLRQLDAQQKPIEVADKRKTADYEAKVAGNEVLKTLMRVQADYVELMNQINNAMEAPLASMARSKDPA